MEVRFINQGDFVTKGNGFLLKGSPDWELDSTISLEMTDLLDDISVFLWGGTEVRGQRSYSWNFNFGTGTSAGRNKQQQKANRGVGIIVAQNNPSSQTSIPGKRCRPAIRTKTLKCKQITAEIKTGKHRDAKKKRTRK